MTAQPSVAGHGPGIAEYGPCRNACRLPRDPCSAEALAEHGLRVEELVLEDLLAGLATYR